MFRFINSFTVFFFCFQIGHIMIVFIGLASASITSDLFSLQSRLDTMPNPQWRIRVSESEVLLSFEDVLIHFIHTN